MTRSRTRHYEHQRLCEHCARLFQSSRYDAHFCSARCRTADHRADQELPKRAAAVKAGIEALITRFGFNNRSRPALVENLIALHRRIEQAIDALDY